MGRGRRSQPPEQHEKLVDARLTKEPLGTVAAVPVVAASHAHAGRIRPLARLRQDDITEQLQIVLSDPTPMSTGLDFNLLSPQTCRLGTQRMAALEAAQPHASRAGWLPVRRGCPFARRECSISGALARIQVDKLWRIDRVAHARTSVPSTARRSAVCPRDHRPGLHASGVRRARSLAVGDGACDRLRRADRAGRRGRRARASRRRVARARHAAMRHSRGPCRRCQHQSRRVVDARAHARPFDRAGARGLSGAVGVSRPTSWRIVPCLGATSRQGHIAICPNNWPRQPTIPRGSASSWPHWLRCTDRRTPVPGNGWRMPQAACKCRRAAFPCGRWPPSWT